MFPSIISSHSTIVTNSSLLLLSFDYRIFSIVVNGGIKHQKKLIQNLRKELNFDQIYEALNKYVYDSFVVRSGVREESSKSLEYSLIF